MSITWCMQGVFVLGLLQNIGIKMWNTVAASEVDVGGVDRHWRMYNWPGVKLYDDGGASIFTRLPGTRVYLPGFLVPAFNVSTHETKPWTQLVYWLLSRDVSNYWFQKLINWFYFFSDLKKIKIDVLINNAAIDYSPLK